MSQAQSDRPPVASVDIVLLIGLYAGQFAAFLLLLGLYKKGPQTLAPFLTSVPGLLTVGAAGVVGVSVFLVAWRFTADRRGDTRAFGLTLAMNLLSVAVILVTGETTIRLMSSKVFEGTPNFNEELLLLPRDWQTVAANYRRQAELRTLPEVFERDPLVGWKLRTDLSDDNDLYTTSPEGWRSGRNVAARTAPPEKRVALVGDSFTFAEDVVFADSWGHMLDEKLGESTLVMNFGVPAFGVDQAYLKYEHTARQFNPDVVILGVFPDDLERGMTVYPLIRRPWWQNQFSKPRVLVADGGIEIVNSPTLSPQEIFARESITDLPYLQYDRGYHAFHWRQRWYHASYLVKFFMSRFQRWEDPAPVNSDAAMAALNLAVVREFIASVSRAGGQPIVTYMPSRRDVEHYDSGANNPSIAKQMLVDGAVPHVDLTPCVAPIPPDERYMLGGNGHYSPRANDAISTCLSDVIAFH